MNKTIIDAIAHTESVIAALRQLGELPAAQPFNLASIGVDTGMIQFFPPGQKRPAGWRDIALPFARAFGGSWQVGSDSECWECLAPAFPGLGNTRIVLHYIEPRLKADPRVINLSEDAPVATGNEQPAEAVQV